MLKCKKNYPARGRLLALLCAAWLPACDQVQHLGESLDGRSIASDVRSDALGSGSDAAARRGSGDSAIGKANRDGSTQTTPPPVPLTARELCTRLLECANLQSPSQLGAFFPVYGTNGTCWEKQSEAQCRQGCFDALAELAKRKSGPPCAYCDTHAACRGRYWAVPMVGTSGMIGACDPRTHSCVECASDADCPKGRGWVWDRPRCAFANDVAKKKCVQCVSDADCSPVVCQFMTGTCSASKSCVPKYHSTLSVNVRGTGIEKWDGKRATIRAATEPLYNCGPGYLAYENVSQGAFQRELPGQVGPKLRITVTIDTNGDLSTVGDPTVTRVVDAPPGQTVVVDVTATDFK